MRARADAAAANPLRDAELARTIGDLQARWEARTRDWEAHGAAPPEALADFPWLLQELRVSLFAQRLKTAVPVSVKRLEKLILSG
jgi:ATP-dependent helicase HrpA